MNLLWKFFNQKPNFWVYQITGFTLFAIVDFFNSNIRTWIHFLFWSVAYLTAILLTFALRPVMRFFYSRKPPFLLFFFQLLVITILFGTAWFFIRHFIYFTFFPSFAGTWHGYFAMTPVKSIITNIYLNSILFFGWGVLYFIIKYRSDVMSEMERSEKAIQYAQEAQLRMLRYQINPHFLFNSLNSIQALIYEDAQQADLMITELSEFLRYTLKYNDTLHVSLDKEMEIINKYLSIEKIRFEERLHYTIEISDEARSKEILCFLLQPFVENAIKHGLKTNLHLLTIIIRVYLRESWLCIEIENSGRWIPQSPNHLSTGIDNIKRRLDNGYPGKYKLEIREDGDWIRIHLRILMA